MFVYLHMLNPTWPKINLTCSWCMILLICYWIQFASILLRIFPAIIHWWYWLSFSSLVFLLAFGIRVMMAMYNEFGSVASFSNFGRVWDGLTLNILYGFGTIHQWGYLVLGFSLLEVFDYLFSLLIQYWCVEIFCFFLIQS